jgi:hypothetical protein
MPLFYYVSFIFSQLCLVDLWSFCYEPNFCWLLVSREPKPSILIMDYFERVLDLLNKQRLILLINS